jgi:hypothetical protein
MNKNGLMSKVLLISAAWAIGWSLDWGLGFAPFMISDTGRIVNWVTAVILDIAIVGVVSVCVTALTLRWIDPSVRLTLQWVRLLLIVIGWCISRLIGLALGLVIDELGVIGWAISGALGGGIMLFVLRRINPAVRGTHALVAAGGWAFGLDFGWYIAFVGGLAMMPPTFPRMLTDLISVFLGGAIGGALGSLVMFWQLSRAQGNPAL